MPNPFSIKTIKHDGTRLGEDAMQPAYSEDEAREKFDKEVKHWQEQVIIPGSTVTIVMQKNDPVQIIEQKTLRG